MAAVSPYFKGSMASIDIQVDRHDRRQAVTAIDASEPCLVTMELQQMAEINVSGFGGDNDSTIVTNQPDVNFTDAALFTLHSVIFNVVRTLGIPGNILSAIVWLRRRVASKNSSAVYLATLAIDDLAYLLLDNIGSVFRCRNRWFCVSCFYLEQSAVTLEPLLVLGFSVERLIAILRPLQVCF